MEKFKGEIVYMYDYKYFVLYKNKKVIVVGVGNFGIDVVVDLSYVIFFVSICNYKYINIVF